MPDPVLLAKAIALAIVVTSIITWLIGRFTTAAGAIGVAMAVLAGAWVLGLAPRIPPQETLDRFLLLLIPAAAAAELVTNSRARWASRAAVAALVTPVLVYGSIYVTDASGPNSREWTPTQTAAIFAGLAVLLFLTWTLVSLLATKAERTTAAALTIAIGGAALTVMLSGYASGGQLGFPLAAAIAVFACFCSRYAPGAAGVAVVGLFSLLVIGRLFAELTTPNALALFLAPLLAWLPELPRIRELSPRGRGALRVALAAIPVIIVLALAQQKFTASSRGPGESPGEPAQNDYLNFGK